MDGTYATTSGTPVWKKDRETETEARGVRQRGSKERESEKEREALVWLCSTEGRDRAQTRVQTGELS